MQAPVRGRQLWAAERKGFAQRALPLAQLACRRPAPIRATGAGQQLPTVASLSLPALAALAALAAAQAKRQTAATTADDKRRRRQRQTTRRRQVFYLFCCQLFFVVVLSRLASTCAGLRSAHVCMCVHGCVCLCARFVLLIIHAHTHTHTHTARHAVALVPQ